MFYENYVRLCKEKGLSRGAVCQAVGLSENAWKRWENGSNPNGKTLKLVADFFDISIKELMKDNAPSQDDGFAARQEVFDRPELRILFNAAQDAPPSAILEVALQLMKLKESNQD